MTAPTAPAAPLQHPARINEPDALAALVQRLQEAGDPRAAFEAIRSDHLHLLTAGNRVHIAQQLKQIYGVAFSTTAWQKDVQAAQKEEAVKRKRTRREPRPGQGGSLTADLLITTEQAVELGEGSGVYYIASPAALAGMWLATQAQPRCLLSGQLRVVCVAASASREGARLSNSFILEYTPRPGPTGQTAQPMLLYVTPETALYGECWRPLAGLAASFPIRQRDCEAAFAAVAALAAQQQAPRQELVPSLAYHIDPATGTRCMVRVNGVITADSVHYVPDVTLRPDVDPRWPQTLPDQDKLPARPDAGVLLRLLRDWWPGADQGTKDSPHVPSCYAVAALGTQMRVRLPGYGLIPGRLPWALEAYRRSGGGKTAFLNLLQALDGAGFRHNSATLLTDGATKDSAIGSNDIRSQLPYHLVTDIDYNAHPDTPEWQQQQQRRRMLNGADGNSAGGGRVSTKTGGRRQRPDPLGVLARTGEVDPTPYDVSGDFEGAAARACIFALPDGINFDRALSEWLEQDGLPHLWALGILRDQWLLRLGPEGVAARAADLLPRFKQLIAQVVAKDPRPCHDRALSQLEDICLGVQLFREFLRDCAAAIDGAEELRTWLQHLIGQLLWERVAYARHMAASFKTARGGIGNKEQVANWTTEQLRGLFKHGRVHVTDLEGGCPLRIVDPQTRQLGPSPNLPPTLTPADLGYLERTAGSGEWQARGVRLGFTDGSRQAFLLFSADVQRLLVDRARDLRYQLPDIQTCWAALEHMGYLQRTTDGRRSSNGPRMPDGKRPRLLVMPWAALFPECAPEPEPDQDTDNNHDSGSCDDTEGQYTL